MNGKKYWLWAFRLAENGVIIFIVDSGGKGVVRPIMIEDFHGPVIVDGLRANTHLVIIQRC